MIDMRTVLQRVTYCHLKSSRQLSTPAKLVYEKYVSGTSIERKISPLVILHGLFGQKTNWRSIGHNLHRRLKSAVFTLDLRNHGDSPWCQTMTYAEMASDVRYFLDEVLPQEIGSSIPVHLLGHSMGGKTAMHVALMRDSDPRLKSLIVEDIAPKQYASSTLSFPKVIEAMKSVNLKCSRSEIEQQLTSTVRDRAVRQFLMTNLVRGTQNSHRWKLNLDSIEEHLPDLYDAGVPDGGPVYTGQCLFVSGAASNYIQTADYPLILELFPKAQFSVIPEAGHWVHSDKPYIFMDIVFQFIRSVEFE